MKLEPIEDRIVVDPEAAASESTGGLIIPDSEREKPQRGIVVAVGNGVIPNDEKINYIITILLWIGTVISFLHPKAGAFKGKEQSAPKMILKPGDKVLYGKLAGSEINIDGKTQLIMRQSDVLSKIVE